LSFFRLKATVAECWFDDTGHLIKTYIAGFEVLFSKQADYETVKVARQIDVLKDRKVGTGATEFLLNISNQQMTTGSVQLDCSSGGYTTRSTCQAFRGRPKNWAMILRLVRKGF